MHSMWQRVQKGGAALLDQVLLSLLNLMIAISFINFATKESYGFYLLLFTPLLLASGLQNALLSSPFMTLYVTKTKEQQSYYTRALLSGQILLGAVLFGASIIGMTIYCWVYQSGVCSNWIILSFGLALLGVLAREGLRSFFYAKKQVEKALKGDLFYGLLLIGMVGGFLVFNQQITASDVLLSIGVSGLSVTAIQLFQYRRVFSSLFEGSTIIWFEFWQFGRWALRGVVLSWINLNAYPYIVALIFGVLAVADLAAARLFWMPLALIIAAWSSVFRPYISGWFSTQKYDQIKRVTWLTYGVGSIVFLFYIGFLYFAYPFLEHYGLNETYQGLFLTAMSWGIFFFAHFIRSVLMGSMMVNERGYQILSQVAMGALVAMLLFMPFTQYFFEQSVIVALALVEVVQIVIIVKFLPEFWGRTHLAKEVQYEY